MRDDEVKVGERYLCHVGGQLAVIEVVSQYAWSMKGGSNVVRWNCARVGEGVPIIRGIRLSRRLTRPRTSAELRPDDGSVKR